MFVREMLFATRVCHPGCKQAPGGPSQAPPAAAPLLLARVLHPNPTAPTAAQNHVIPSNMARFPIFWSPWGRALQSARHAQAAGEGVSPNQLNGASLGAQTSGPRDWTQEPLGDLSYLYALSARVRVSQIGRPALRLGESFGHFPSGGEAQGRR